jgi:hypothetical protein
LSEGFMDRRETAIVMMAFTAGVGLVLLWQIR